MIFWYILACQTGEKPETESVPQVDEPPALEEDVLGEGEIEEEVDAPSRQLKRMTIAQVRDSMERISGGIRWGDSDESNWDVFSDTLGVADYQLRVETDRSPSVMFQKFLDDAAMGTCLEWIRAEGSSFFSDSTAESIDRTDVRSTIVDLRWQIQGKAKDHQAVIIDDYEDLFFTVYQRTASTEASWQSICVAMFTHPDFFMY